MTFTFFLEFFDPLHNRERRVPISAACASFPAKMRESSIRLCEAHLHTTADVAIKASKAAAAAATASSTSYETEGNTDLSPRRENIKTTPLTYSSSSPGTMPTETTQGSRQREANQGLTAASISAVFRAGCLVAAQGLMDPAQGPRAAGASMAMSVLSLSWLPSWRDDAETVNETVNETANETVNETVRSAVGNNDHSQAQADDDSRDLKNETADLHRGAPENRQVGDNHLSDNRIDPNNPKIAAADLLILPLKELRWGLELLLGCVATHLAHGGEEGGEIALPVFSTSKERAAGRCACDGRYLSATGEEDSAEPTREGANIGEIRTENEKGASGRLRKGRGNFTDGLPSTSRTAENGGRTQTAYNLVDFSCRCPHIGPALVASILVRWIPFLATWGRVPPPPPSPSPPSLDTTATTSRGATLLLAHGPASVGPSAKKKRFAAAPAAAENNNSRSKEVDWRRRGPPGEEEAAGMLAAGATRMLALMLRLDVQLLPLSDFSAEALAVAAEHAMSFGNAHSTDAGREWPRQGTTSARRSKRECEARRAGEALMLELVLAHGVGGTVADALMPSLSSARGIACLHEASASLLTRTNSSSRARKYPARRGDATVEAGVGEGGGRKGSCSERVTSRGGGVERYFGRLTLCDKCGETKTALFIHRTPFGKIDVRRRLEIPQSRLPPPSGDRGFRTGAPALGNGGICAAGGDVCTPENGDNEDIDDATMTAAVAQNRHPGAVNPRPSLDTRRKLQEEEVVVCDDGQSGSGSPRLLIDPAGSNKGGITSELQSVPRAGEEPGADPDIGVVVDSEVVAKRSTSGGSRRKVLPLNKGGSMMGASSSKSMLELGESSAVREATGSNDDIVSDIKNRGIDSTASKAVNGYSSSSDVAKLEKEKPGGYSSNGPPGITDVGDDSVAAAGIEEERGGGTRGTTASTRGKSSGGGWMKKTLGWFRK